VIELLPDRVPEDEDVKRLSDSLSARGDITRVAIDMSYLVTINSLLLARMITLNRCLQASKGKLVLCGLAPVVREILRRTHTDSLFELNGCQSNTPNNRNAEPTISRPEPFHDHISLKEPKRDEDASCELQRHTCELRYVQSRHSSMHPRTTLKPA
jgi:anti-anti-sigma regulatory factor